MDFGIWVVSAGSSLHEITEAHHKKIAIAGRPTSEDVLVWGNKHDLYLEVCPLLCNSFHSSLSLPSVCEGYGDLNILMVFDDKA